MEAPVHSSNVMLYSRAEKVASRVGHRVLEDGSKVRYLVKTGEVIDKPSEWKRTERRRSPRRGEPRRRREGERGRGGGGREGRERGERGQREGERREGRERGERGSYLVKPGGAMDEPAEWKRTEKKEKPKEGGAPFRREGGEGERRGKSTRGGVFVLHLCREAAEEGGGAG